MRTPVLIATALVATACSSGESSAPSTASSALALVTTTPSPAGASRCQVVAQEDQLVTDALIDKGCTDDKGSARLGKITLCKDGRRLWEMGDLIGLSGELIYSRETKAEGGIPVWSLHYRICKG